MVFLKKSMDDQMKSWKKNRGMVVNGDDRRSKHKHINKFAKSWYCENTYIEFHLSSVSIKIVVEPTENKEKTMKNMFYIKSISRRDWIDRCTDVKNSE